MEGTQCSNYNNSLFWTGQFDKLVRGKEYISSTDQKRKKNKDWTKEIKIVPPSTVSFHSLSHCDKKGLQMLRYFDTIFQCDWFIFRQVELSIMYTM